MIVPVLRLLLSAFLEGKRSILSEVGVGLTMALKYGGTLIQKPMIVLPFLQEDLSDFRRLQPAKWADYPRSLVPRISSFLLGQPAIQGMQPCRHLCITTVRPIVNSCFQNEMAEIRVVLSQ